MEADQLDALLAVTAAMEQLEVPFFIAGSFASNVYGFYRATADADLVADVKVRHIEPLGVSDRQWGDVTGVMKVQAENLDLAYLRRWADELRLRDLLDRALSESGLT